MRNDILDDLIPRFVWKSDSRVNLQQPYADGDKIVMTDAHILVIAPCEYFKGEYTSHPNFPDYKAIIPDTTTLTCYELSMSHLRTEYEILDRTNVYEDCIHCDGEGSQICDLEHEHECTYCDGTGTGFKIIGNEVDSRKHVMSINGITFNPERLNDLSILSERIGIDVVKFYNTDRIGYFSINDIFVVLSCCDTEDNPLVHPVDIKVCQ